MKYCETLQLCLGVVIPYLGHQNTFLLFRLLDQGDARATASPTLPLPLQLLHGVFGELIIVVIICLLVFGTAIKQLWRQLQLFPTDRLLVRILVAFMLCSVQPTRRRCAQ